MGDGEVSWGASRSDSKAIAIPAPIKAVTTSTALIAEFVRRRAGLFAKKSREVRRIGKPKLVGNVVDRLRGEDELALGFGEHALADQMTGGDAGRAFDVVVEPVSRHAELFRIKAE